MSARWLLVARLGGVTGRWCSGVTDVSVGGYVWRAALPDLELSRPQSADVSIGITLIDGVDYATQAARGVVLEGQPATLYRWTEGDAFELARVWLSGRVRGVQVGSAADGLTFSVAVSGVDDTDPILEPRARIDSVTLPDVSGVAAYTRLSGAEGAVYPVVIGYPGSGMFHPVVPAPMARECTTALTPGLSEIMIAAGDLNATTVKILDVEIGGTQVDTFPVSYRVDELGTRYGYALVGDGDNYPSPALWTASSEQAAFYIAFDDEAGRGGGLLDPYGTGPIEGAGAAIRWALLAHGGRLLVDVDDLNRFVSVLDEVRIDTWINDPEILAWEWIEDAILPYVSARVVHTGAGLSIRPWDWTCRARQAVAQLEHDRNVTRAGRARTYAEAGGTANEITIEYRPQRGGVAYMARRVFSSEYERRGGFPLSGVGADDRVHPHEIARASQRDYGAVYPLTVQCPHVWHDSAADVIGLEVLRARALPHAQITYTAQGSALEHLLPCDVVTLTDAELGYTDAPALVHDLKITAAGVAVVLVVPHALVRAS